MKRILVVEDDPGIRELLRLNLSMAGHKVSEASSVDEALACLRISNVALLVIDWNLPGRSGMWLLRHLRGDAAHRTRPIIMLTARDDELDKVHAFDTGADDYVTKPFKVREFLARVQSLLRRTERDVDSKVLEIDGLRLDIDQHRATIGGVTLALGPTEYKLLHYLASNPMRVHSRSQLLNQVWGHGTDLQERTVDAYVGRLRNLIESTGHHACIETVRSMGYRFLRRGMGSEVHGSASMAQARG